MRLTRVWLGLILLAALCGSACESASLTLYAQSLPAVKHAVWTPNAAADAVTTYVVTVNGVKQTVAPSTCSPTQCSAAISLVAYGNQTVTVAAQNLALSTDPTSVQTGPALSVTFTLSQAPSAPTGGTVTN